MSKQSAQTNSKFLKPKIKHQKLSKTKTNVLDFETGEDSSLKDSFILMVTDGKHTQQMTVHHPIGVTNMDNEEWVATDSSGVPHLLSSKEHPFKEKYDRAIDKLITSIASRHSYVEYKLDGVELKHDGVSQFKLVTDARNKARVYWKEMIPMPKDWDQSSEGAWKRPALPEFFYLHFLDKKLVADEIIYQRIERSLELRRELEQMFPIPLFENRGGPQHTELQRPLQGAKGLSKQMVMDQILQTGVRSTERKDDTKSLSEIQKLIGMINPEGLLPGHVKTIQGVKNHLLNNMHPHATMDELLDAGKKAAPKHVPPKKKGSMKARKRDESKRSARSAGGTPKDYLSDDDHDDGQKSSNDEQVV